VWYRIILTVRDSAGLTQTVVRDVLPRKARLTLATSPAGLLVKLDAQPRATPFTVDSVVGIERTLEAVSPQVSSGGTVYQFTAWSDGRARVHILATPAADTTYTAAYAAAGSGSGDGLAATYYDNADFSGASVARVDPAINFDWGTGSPAPTIGVDTFSVRWVGQLEAPISGAYTFFTQTTDGVRLWVNRQLIINNWTNHPVTENTGTITLNAGQRYAIQMDFYENTGRATAKLLWSAPSMSKAVVPTVRLYSQVPTSSILINFQTATAPVPAGYLADGGARYGDRGNGHAYGWNVDNTAQARDRNAANSPDQRYDTLVYMQKPANPNGSWELALPNGTYRVRIVAGDPSFFGGTFAITAENTLVVSGSTTSAARWLEGTATVAVSDGRLTLRNGAGATTNEICFIEITTP
jgi:hypothetical protein